MASRCNPIGTIVDRLRVRLEEPTARKWSNADQLIPYASEAERWLARMLSRLPKSRRFRVLAESLTIPADTSIVAVSGLAKRFDYLIKVDVLVGNVRIPCPRFEDADDTFLRNMSLAGGVLVPAVQTQDDNLVFLPTHGAARTAYVSYGWIPTIKTSTGTTLETPQEYDGDVVQRALHFALSDLGVTNTSFEEQYAARLAEIEDLERSRIGVSTERVVRTAHSFSRCR